MEALSAYERELCECGFHKSLSRDRANHFTFEDDKCPVCAGAAQYARIQGDRDEKARKARGEKRPAGMPDPADGRRTHIRLMGGDEIKQSERGRRGD